MESWVHESDSNLSQLRIKFRRCQHRNGIRRRVCSNVQEDHGSPVFAVAPPCHLEPPHLPPLLPSQGRHTSNQSHLCLSRAQSQRSLLPLGTLNRTAAGLIYLSLGTDGPAVSIQNTAGLCSRDLTTHLPIDLEFSYKFQNHDLRP